MPKRHTLGSAAGTILEYEDGTAGYLRSGAFTQQFRVRIADVTAFSVTKDRKVLERMLNIMGEDALLGSASVNHKESERIEKWFRAHPLFGGNVRVSGQTVPTPNASTADELRKLADLHEQGVLTDEEFAAQKAQLLGS